MNIKATDNVLKFFILVGAASYGAIKFMQYKDQEIKRSKEKENDRVESYSSEKVDLSSVKCNEPIDEMDKLSYIKRVRHILHTNTEIDEDDLTWDEDYLKLNHHIRIEDNGDDKIYLKIELPLDKNREYQKVADMIMSDFKKENNISPYIRKEGYLVTDNEEENSIEWAELSGYQSFMDLVNFAKSNDGTKLFYSVDIKKNSINPQKLSELIERLLNNDEYSNGIEFGPVILVDVDGEW